MKSLQKLSRSEVQSLSELTLKKYRVSRGEFLVEGVHLVTEALSSDWEVEKLIFSETFTLNKEWGRINNEARIRGTDCYTITEKETGKLSDTVTSQGVFAVIKNKQWNLSDILKTPKADLLLVALESVSDPGNVGTILRTCDWFGVDAVILGGDSVELFNPKVVRSTMGALFHLPVITDADLPHALSDAKRNGIRVVGTMVEGGSTLRSGMLSGKNLLLFGNEAHGLSENALSQAGMVVSIPRFGKTESMNVAAACAVILCNIKIK